MASASRSLGCFAVQCPGPQFPLSTLLYPPYGWPRMTRGRCGSLLLHRTTLSFASSRRFFPAHNAPPFANTGRKGGPPVREKRGEGKPDTFDFLGFTHICAKTSKGRFAVLRQTIRKRLLAKLSEVKTELRRRMHDPVPEVGQWLKAVVSGHIR